MELAVPLIIGLKDQTYNGVDDVFSSHPGCETLPCLCCCSVCEALTGGEALDGSAFRGDQRAGWMRVGEGIAARRHGEMTSS